MPKGVIETQTGILGKLSWIRADRNSTGHQREGNTSDRPTACAKAVCFRRARKAQGQKRLEMVMSTWYEAAGS